MCGGKGAGYRWDTGGGGAKKVKSQVYKVTSKLRKDATTTAATSAFVIRTSLSTVNTREAWSRLASWTSSLLLLVIFANLTDKVGECLVDINALLGRSLDKLAAEMLGKITAL
jgi:hypothetical protein